MATKLDLTGYRLTFADEFNLRSISQTGEGTTWADIRPKWLHGAHSDLGFGYASFVDPASGYDPFKVSGGALSITAVPDRTPAGYKGNWESGLITSQGNFSQTYGYFEMRAQLANELGAWDAFWLMPDKPAANPKGLPGHQELDIVEHVGSNEGGVYSTLHTTDATPAQQLQYYSSHPGLTSAYHTYGVDWQADRISFYFDGQYMGSRPTPTDMHGPMHVIANLATQNKATNNPDAAGVPITMMIDYIRVYSKDGKAVAIARDTASAPDGQDPGLYGATSAAPTPAWPQVPSQGTANGTWKETAPDGSRVAATYDAAGLVKSVKTTHTDGSSETLAYTKGQLTSETRVHADKSKDVFLSGITGKTYTAEHDAYDSAGTLTATLRTRADGTKDYSYTLGPDGTKTTGWYDATGLALKNHTVVTPDGGAEAKTFTAGTLTRSVVTFASGGPEASITKTFDAGGRLTSETQIHADKSKDVFLSGITGKTYAAEHDVYDSAGTLTDSLRTRADGTKDYSYTLGPDGTKTTDWYDATGLALKNHTVVTPDGGSEAQTFTAGTLTRSVVTFAPGGPETSITRTFDAGGRLTGETQVHADKSRDVFQSGLTGKTYTDRHDSYGSDGKLESTDLTNLDHSHTQTAMKPGQILVSTPGVTDVFKGAGGDTFVFTAGSGKDVVLGFRAGGAPGHDVLMLDASVIPDYAALQGRLHASGPDTLIQMSTTDTILLKSVSLTGLSAHDFTFVDHGLFLA